MFRILQSFSMLFVLVIAISSASMVDAQVATPDPASLPAGAAPLGLGAVTLPDDEQMILTLFGSLPGEVADETGNPLVHAGDRILATYGHDEGVLGPPLVLSAISFEQGDFFPAAFTAGDYVVTASQTADAGTTAFGRDGTLVWISAETTVGADGDRPGTPVISEPLYTLAWGDIDGGWIFMAAARTPEDRDALVAAFVTAAQKQTATPEAQD